LFGVPYAANTQVVGCSARNDVFLGRLQLVTNTAAPVQNNNWLLPLYFNNNLNNYQTGATDTIGKTTKTITFNVPVNLTDANFYLITSNHGANSGGEEYNRRFHYAYFDSTLMLTYKPGRTTCEPFRQYNTQGNGIYGTSPKTPAQWQSFSNWCPGDVIDIHEINLGAVAAGNHTFTIRVPAAIFNGAQGNFPLSLYCQGKTNNSLGGIKDNLADERIVSIYPNPTSGTFTVDLNTNTALITVTDLLGKKVFSKQTTQKQTNLQLDENGIYLVYVTTKQGTSAHKLIVNK
jgi:hypothetical protein